jgi:putative heme-binding domain-containing protein
MPQQFIRKLAFLIFFLAPAFANQAFSQSTDDGKRTFASTCAACHGLDGRGAERGPDIARRRAVQQLSDASLSTIVRDGKPGTGMPPFPGLGEGQIQAVVRHLRELQGQGSSAVLPGDPKAGKVLFFGKGECAQCHIAHGRGGFMGSDLTSFASGKPVADIYSAITEPNNLDPRRQVVVVKTSDGATLSGIARNEDNFSLQLQTSDGAFHFFDKSQVQSIEHQPRSLMPEDYGSKLSRQELEQLVSYLMSIAQKPTAQKAQEEEEE